VFLPAAMLVVFVWYWATGATGLGKAVRLRLPSFALAVAAGAVIIWAGYRFSWAGVPAPELFAGIRDVLQHNSRGHWAYLLGARSPLGFWYFYPVALAVKTPLPLLALAAFGVVLVFRKTVPRLWIPLCFAAAVLQAGMMGHINIGIRHVLPVHMGMALLAAAAVMKMIESRRMATGVAVVLLACFAGSSILSHPDYIAYFNLLAGTHPENVLVDSDLDWGQDIKRAAVRLRELGAREVMFPQFVVADLEKEHGFPHLKRPIDVIHQPEGYFLAGATFWKADRFGLPEDQPIWLDRAPPTERIGKGMFLWYRAPRARGGEKPVSGFRIDASRL